jgi:hypothetical protein
LTVSGCHTGAVRRCRCLLDNHAAFPSFCVKAENGFVAAENCSVTADRRNNDPETPANFIADARSPRPRSEGCFLTFLGEKTVEGR